jgi:hypothetical protein
MNDTYDRGRGQEMEQLTVVLVVLTVLLLLLTLPMAVENILCLRRRWVTQRNGRKGLPITGE